MCNLEKDGGATYCTLIMDRNTYICRGAGCTTYCVVKITRSVTIGCSVVHGALAYSGPRLVCLVCTVQGNARRLPIIGGFNDVNICDAIPNNGPRYRAYLVAIYCLHRNSHPATYPALHSFNSSVAGYRIRCTI